MARSRTFSSSSISARSSGVSTSVGSPSASMRATVAAQIGSAAVGKDVSSSRSGGSERSAPTVQPSRASQNTMLTTSRVNCTLPPVLHPRATGVSPGSSVAVAGWFSSSSTTPR